MSRRTFRPRRKVCQFCKDKEKVLDYKDVEQVKNFISDAGKILPRRVTGTCAKHQRDVNKAVKRARAIAIIPYEDK
ncbi:MULTISPECIES: 30S ribosomal protein S18 [Kallipyga]|uniref:30S ribosomal protein S18 n=1 Tax=Kallipyga TaxID=1472763 RepID=UPI0004B2C274|nr:MULTISPECIES: 30S ribosomal protein S18 [Kallipyga]